MISIKHKGSFSKTNRFFRRSIYSDYIAVFDKYGKEGVSILSSSTPEDTGETSHSWQYKIERFKRGLVLSWHNTNIVNGVSIAIILQYGHATRNGGYVKGTDYINPAMRPLFNSMAESIWKEVKNL